MGLLDTVKTSADVKKLKIEQLPILAEEIRQRIISVVETNGGHLSSNLGAVEAIIALHYVFDFPKDKLIFDVGHQSYAHKILSGRNDTFTTIRKKDGLSGFPNVFESEYDAFCVGHAGNSISASLGYCVARDVKKEDYYVIDLVGDASFFNGENLEALISSDNKPKKMLIILNDNGMSISKNNNGLYRLISTYTTKKSYRRLKRIAQKAVGWNFIGRALKKLKDFIKVSLNHKTAAESLGFKYLGVYDGHNIKGLIKILTNVKDSCETVLLHLKTVKGKGVADAEQNPSYYHGVGSNLKSGVSTFSSAISGVLQNAVDKGEPITAICAGMKDGTGLVDFADKNPRRFYDVGIAEEHAVTFAAGQAIGGLKPIVCIYSTFLQRAYDQIMQDVCLQNLPVIFMIDRAGAVGADGATHQGLFDLSYLRNMPNMSVFAPKDTIELENVFNYCLKLGTPCSIRYPNGINTEFETHTDINESLWETFGEGENVILAVGPRMLRLAFDVQKEYDGKVQVVNARCIKPLYKSIIDSFSGKNVIVLEENVKSGGFGSFIAETLSENKIVCNLTIKGFDDKFVAHASVLDQLESVGLTKSEIVKLLKL